MSQDHNGPDFIVAGFRRSRTTLLYEILRHDSNFELPIIKEINQFSASDHIRKFTLEKIRESFFYHQSAIDLDYSYMEKVQKIFNKLHSLSPFSQEWYESFFEFKDKGKISGDISPVYENLNLESLQYIKNTYDPIVVLLVRDPRERTISCYRHEQNYFPIKSWVIFRRELINLFKTNSSSSEYFINYKKTINKFRNIFGDKFYVLNSDLFDSKPNEIRIHLNTIFQVYLNEENFDFFLGQRINALTNYTPKHIKLLAYLGNITNSRYFIKLTKSTTFP